MSGRTACARADDDGPPIVDDPRLQALAFGCLVCALFVLV